MHSLVVEDDPTSRRILKTFLSRYGECDTVVNGQEAVDSFVMAHASKRPYDLICMDIMMPVLDGQEALQVIRRREQEMQVPPGREVKVIMTSAMDDPGTVIRAFYEGEATSYILKPLSREKLVKELGVLNLLA
jgi:two-component system, chemotaxis family, chemotaxis protein CheY